ncbi:MAG TPA: glycosyltransferase family 87 protein, partial [Stellaceae bacterium]|nr:glycosyltransferase family 87 protein [Stellaceae bacterium]
MSTSRFPVVAMLAAAVAAIYAWTVVALTPSHHGAIGLDLNALGSDYTVFYSGAQYFFDGKLAQLFNGDQFTDFRNALFANWLSSPSPFVPWVYPPSFLLLMLPFGALPFVASYAAFQAVTALLLALALNYRADRPEARPLVMVLALIGPAAAMNFGWGQNAFLATALLVGGFRLLPTRPVLGGIVLGLLTVKPQFWILVPVALVAARQWRALVWSLIAAAALAAASAAVFGIDLWRQWLELALGGYWQSDAKWVGYARVWGMSVFATLFSTGVPGEWAELGQWAATLIGAALTYLGFRARLPHDNRIAVLLACTILAAPHSSLHDLVLLATAAALWMGAAAEDGATLPQWTLALAVWLTALYNPPIVSPVGRLTPLLILAFV